MRKPPLLKLDGIGLPVGKSLPAANHQGQRNRRQTSSPTMDVLLVVAAPLYTTLAVLPKRLMIAM